MNFDTAKSQYPNRYTMEHVPAWAKKSCTNGKYYAPQYSSDKEWFESTKFPPDAMCNKNHCYSSGETWPLGQWLDAPYIKWVKS